MIDRTIAYVYVADISKLLALWPEARVIVWGDTAHAGTREALVEHRGRTMIVAELIERAG